MANRATLKMPKTLHHQPEGRVVGNRARRHLRFLHREHAIDRDVLKNLSLPAGPVDRELVGFGAAQAEVDAAVILRKITGAGHALGDLLASASQQFQVRANAIPIALLSFQLHREPVIAVLAKCCAAASPGAPRFTTKASTLPSLS